MRAAILFLLWVACSAVLKSHAEIVQKFRRGLDAGHQQVIPRACAGHVEQVALGVVDFLQVRVVADRFDPFL